MKQLLITMLMLGSAGLSASAQTIAVNPTGVNVNSQNSTVVFLTFGQIPAGYTPAEAIWCGELIPATLPALGLQCRPDTIYGSLPVRFDLSQSSGAGGFTDIMAIPPSVVRRAYQAAVRGASAGFFYVRRFVSASGPDQFVNVTCRMSGGGARVPFALTDVQIKTPNSEPILFLKKGEKLPEILAEIQYNGTGRLKGRWEIVQPGEQQPTDRDLLTEATLPVEDRASQKRFTQVGRFNEFLAPVGKFTLKLENPERVPINADGQYLLLLRIEATDDKESDSNLVAVGVGPGTVHSGAVAAFPMPALKFFVTGSGDAAAAVIDSTGLSADSIVVDSAVATIFSWPAKTDAAFYKLMVFDENDKQVLGAFLTSPSTSYKAPPWFNAKFSGKRVHSRVMFFDANGVALPAPLR